jgi:predicted O-linked N-acetylglucosamine transferase (SPINDLY family)
MTTGPPDNDDEIACLLSAACQQHGDGNWPEAERLYRELLELEPGHAQALYLLGTGKAQNNDPAAAVVLLRQAIEKGADTAGVRVNLGNALLQTGQAKEAEVVFRKAVSDYPADADAWFGLGRVTSALQDPVAAQECFEQALVYRPGFAQARFQLGLTLFHQGWLAEAEECYRDALRLNPQLVHIHSQLGKVLQKLGRPEEAVAEYRQYVNARPDAADGWNNLGLVQRQLEQLDAAAESCRRALEINPGLAQTWNNLGNILKTLGQFDEAVAHYRRAVQLKPDFTGAHSNLILCLNYVPVLDEEELYKEHLRWAAAHVQECRQDRSYANEPDPSRRLQVGYVSPDLRTHAVASFFEPLLANHNHAVVEVTCYAQVARSDVTTRRLQSQSDHWCCTVGMSNAELASRIRADGIDILVDLAGHTARNRLLVFGLCPAPIQLSAIGYPNTTGMQAIDYRLTDAIADLAGAEHFYTEKLLRLEHGMTVYRPPDNAPAVGPLPAGSGRGVTFGSLNNLVKLNQEVIALWSDVIKRVPDSRLLLFRDMLKGSMAERVRADFSRCGIAGDRLELRHELSPDERYLSVYGFIDIGLDPFPWNGHVTTCEALWMGVPVVALRGPVQRGRLAASLLHQVGLDELVAGSRADYITIAADLAADQARLARLREGLRARVAASALCDGPGLAREVEGVYRNVWQCWCAGTKGV